MAGRPLRRLRNALGNPQEDVLVQRYTEAAQEKARLDRLAEFYWNEVEEARSPETREHWRRVARDVGAEANAKREEMFECLSHVSPETRGSLLTMRF